MGIVYIKCHHDNLKKDCRECISEKEEMRNRVYDLIKEQKDEPKQIPIRRGCVAAEHGGCFCTGACQEIIGYQE